MINRFIKFNFKFHNSFIPKRKFSENVSNTTYYQILNVSPQSNAQEIKESYLKLAKLNHPDLHPGDEAKRKIFLLINEAYSVLSKPQEKEEYDLRTHLRSMEFQYTPPNPWSIDYPQPPPADSDKAVKEIYKEQTKKMWSEGTAKWQEERHHYQSSRGVKLKSYNTHPNFRYFNRTSGQEVVVFTMILGFYFIVMCGGLIYYSVKEKIYNQAVTNDQDLIWDNFVAFTEIQSKYDIDDDLKSKRTFF